MPGEVRPYLCPLTLIDTTRGSRKSHSRSGCRNGPTKPPLAASTCTGRLSPPPVGRVDVHGGAESPACGQFVQRVADLTDRFQLAGERGAEDRHHADGVLV